jgi:hypothetical protein
VDALAELAERCGMREFVVRAHVHRARLGVLGVPRWLRPGTRTRVPGP